jgi:beta-galactosidase/beta-glucuronidase
MVESSKIVPKPEHPRPQFQRSDWINLNGTWEFAFDDDRIGLTEGWSAKPLLPQRIVVPFPYQCELSGINDKEIHQVVWYARTLEYRPEWRDCGVLLHFGAVDYESTLFVNGERVGANRGGHVPFSFDISHCLREGSNRIVIRVEDKQDQDQPRGKQSSSGKPFGIDYYCTTGIWQTVWLEPVPQKRVGNVRITPLLDRESVEFEVLLHAPAGARAVEIEVLDKGRSVTSTRQETFRSSARLTVPIPNAKLWSPDDPHLYDVVVRLFENGELLDEVESYFGMRSTEVKNGVFLLNGEPTYLRLVLDQGYWPESYLAAPSDEAVRLDVELTKQMGFNGARKHQKVEDPRWLYWCDRLGLLVWGEMANAREWSETSEEALLNEWTRAVQRDYNSPAVVAWVPINESWGVPQVNHGSAEQYGFVERAVTATRRVDPYRPVVDNDGWEHTDVTDICTIHDYTSTGTGITARYSETSKGGLLPFQTWGGGCAVFCEGSTYHGQPIMLTEVGGFLTRPVWLPKDQWDGLYNSYGSIDNGDELIAKYRDLTEAIASLPFVSGFCYTQLTDVEQEMNGLLTYDRQPKAPLEEIAKINLGLKRAPADVSRISGA